MSKLVGHRPGTRRTSCRAHWSASGAGRWSGRSTPALFHKVIRYAWMGYAAVVAAVQVRTLGGLSPAQGYAHGLSTRVAATQASATPRSDSRTCKARGTPSQRVDAVAQWIEHVAFRPGAAVRTRPASLGCSSRQRHRLTGPKVRPRGHFLPVPRQHLRDEHQPPGGTMRLYRALCDAIAEAATAWAETERLNSLEAEFAEADWNED